MRDLLWLIPLLPLAGFLVNGLLRPARAAAALVGCAGPAASFGLSLWAAWTCARSGPLADSAFTWIAAGDLRLDFGLRVDELSAVMILVVTGVGTLIHLYSIAYMHGDEGFSRYFAYLNLFMFSMLVLVMGDSIVLMFLGWEGVGLCSYLLIGFWYRDLKNADAGKKAFITNRIGDFGFLLGIFVLWKLYPGTLDFAEMAARPVGDLSLAAAAGLLLFLGACGKSAQIPLHVWLPDAMAGPTPVSALIHAATMVTAGVYMIGRMHFLYAAVPEVTGVIVLVAAATALLAALVACAQHDIKKVLAWSTISQLGFMFAGMASTKFTTGIFHLVTHAFFKALLFLGAGAVIHALHGEQDIRRMGGLARRMPLLAACFVIGGLALAGLPLTSGYVSKDAILAAVDDMSLFTSYRVAWIALAITALLTAFYTTRLIVIVFLAPPSAPSGDLHRPGPLMRGPVLVLAALSAAGGLLLDGGIYDFLGRVWRSPSAGQRLGGDVHDRNMYVSWAVFLVGFLAAFLLYGRASGWRERLVEGPLRGLQRLVANRFYVDEIYELLVVAPVKTGAAALWYVVDRVLIDGILVHGAGRLTYAVGSVLRRPHSGSLNAGLVAFALGVLAALAWLFYRLAT